MKKKNKSNENLMNINAPIDKSKKRYSVDILLNAKKLDILANKSEVKIFISEQNKFLLFQQLVCSLTINVLILLATFLFNHLFKSYKLIFKNL